MGQRAKWDLPDTPEPASDRCFLVKVPDDPKHLAAFRGALYELSKPYAWGDDENHTALLVGARWLNNWMSIEELDCSMLHQTQIEFDPDCGLKWSYDGGVTWTTISLEACARFGAQQEIVDAILDGQIQGGTGQQGPQTPPEAGTCRIYHVRLNARDQWLCPSPVSAGDTVYISNAQGGWFDGVFAWFCPDGSAYVLGECFAGGQDHDASDPLNPGAYHMQIIGLIGATYFDPMSAVYTVPSGVIEQPLYVQANDGTLADNMGEVEFDVEICSGAWTHTFDFLTSDGGWSDMGNGSSWITGQGWRGGGTGNRDAFIHRLFTDVHILSIIVSGYTASVGGANQLYNSYGKRNSTTEFFNSTAASAGNFIRNLTVNETLDEIELDYNSGTTGGAIYITQVQISGSGEDPF